MVGSPELDRFAEIVSCDDFPLDHAALLIGAWDHPERDLGEPAELGTAFHFSDVSTRTPHRE